MIAARCSLPNGRCRENLDATGHRAFVLQISGKCGIKAFSVLYAFHEFHVLLGNTQISIHVYTHALLRTRREYRMRYVLLLILRHPILSPSSAFTWQQPRKVTPLKMDNLFIIYRRRRFFLATPRVFF